MAVDTEPLLQIREKISLGQPASVLILMPHYGYYGHPVPKLVEALALREVPHPVDLTTTSANQVMLDPADLRLIRTTHLLAKSPRSWVRVLRRLREERYDFVCVSETPIAVQRVFYQAMALLANGRRVRYLRILRGRYTPEPLTWPGFLRDLLRPRTLRTLAARLGNLASRRRRSPRSLGLPSRYLIEITNVCNLSCPLCPTGQNAITHGQGMMDFEKYKQLIDECAPSMEHLDLYNFGEPLLHPKFTEMVAHAKAKGVGTVQVSTNANIDLTPDRARRLIECGLDNIVVACDGADQETYAKYRVRGRLDKLIAFVRLLSDEKRRLGRVTPQIIVRFIPMRHNEHQVEVMERLAYEWGADKFVRYNLSLFYGRDKGNFDKFHPTNEKYKTFVLVQENGVEVAKCVFVQRCAAAWETFNIAWNGKAIPCCADFDATQNFGDVFEEGARAVWNGPRIQAFRRQFIRDKNQIPLCRDCDNIA